MFQVILQIISEIKKKIEEVGQKTFKKYKKKY